MTTPDEPDLTAAELALGVLEGEERAAAFRRVLADPAFARDVERWRRRLSALYAEIPSIEPRTEVQRRITTSSDANGKGLRLWRAMAAVAAAAAAVLLFVAVHRTAPQQVPAVAARSAPLQVAILTPKEADPVAIVFNADARTLKLRGSVPVPHGRDAELWAINADGVPHAAGLVSKRAGTQLKVLPDVAIAAGTTLAISIEPAGGSPKATPTGPVVASGKLATI